MNPGGGVRYGDVLASLGIQLPLAPPRPRAPPRFIRPPTPVVIERPEPIVSDVSLIADSAATSLYSSPDFDRDSDDSIRILGDINRAGRPRPAENNNDEERSVDKIFKIVSQQNAAISSIEAQLKQIVAFQEKLLVHFVQKGVGVSKGTQTENFSNIRLGQDERGKLNAGVRLSNSPTGSLKEQSKSNQSSNGHLKRNSESSRNSREEKKSPSPYYNEVPVVRNVQAGPITSVRTGTGDKHTEDVSTVLKNLQISNVPGPSMYSQASINSVEISQFNDDSFQHNNSCVGSPNIGPSASAYGSSSEDEVDIAEAATPDFYKNLLGTVNRFLEGGERRTPGNGSRPNDRSSPITPRNSLQSDSLNSNSGIMQNLAQKYVSPKELNQYEVLQAKNGGTTTVYGMSAKNLSFATKKYLQKYGLVDQSAPVPSASEPIFHAPQFPQRAYRPWLEASGINDPAANDRILDITAIKNQPKLL